MLPSPEEHPHENPYIPDLDERMLLFFNEVRFRLAAFRLVRFSDACFNELRFRLAAFRLLFLRLGARRLVLTALVSTGVAGVSAALFTAMAFLAALKLVIKDFFWMAMVNLPFLNFEFSIRLLSIVICPYI